MRSWTKAEKRAFVGLPTGVAVVLAVARTIVQAREGVADISEFIVDILRDPLAIAAFALLILCAVVCRDDIQWLMGYFRSYTDKEYASAKDRFLRLDDDGKAAVERLVHAGHLPGDEGLLKAEASGLVDHEFSGQYFIPDDRKELVRDLVSAWRAGKLGD